MSCYAGPIFSISLPSSLNERKLTHVNDMRKLYSTSTRTTCDLTCLTVCVLPENIMDMTKCIVISCGWHYWHYYSLVVQPMSPTAINTTLIHVIDFDTESDLTGPLRVCQNLLLYMEAIS
jgi:hypothetical protein